MSLSLSTKYLNDYVSENEALSFRERITQAHKTLHEKTGAGSDFLGWLDLPRDYDKEEYARIKDAAARIRKSSKVFIVIGIGGSYLGARSAIEFIKSPFYNELDKDTPNIYFAGNNISSDYLSEIIELIGEKDFSVNVISKSGTTTEPAVAFRIFSEMLIEKYGKEGAAKRIFCTTDKSRGTLKKMADEMGCDAFVIPDNIGGRYSVLTAVGLLPMAVAGIDIDAVMQGASDAMREYADCDLEKNNCYKYALYRNVLFSKGKTIEIMANYEPSLVYFSEWWKQLYGESEGKDGTGIFPAAVTFSTDLHSMGQYIQQGVRSLFETVVRIEKCRKPIVVKEDPENSDGLNFIAGKEMSYINEKACEGTLLAHSDPIDGEVPNMVLSVPCRDEYNYGYLVYFFEKACAISGYALGVNPFNQPGVESYKKNMFALLGKPGYEDMRAELEAKL